MQVQAMAERVGDVKGVEGTFFMFTQNGVWRVGHMTEEERKNMVAPLRSVTAHELKHCSVRDGCDRLGVTYARRKHLPRLISAIDRLQAETVGDKENTPPMDRSVVFEVHRMLGKLRSLKRRFDAEMEVAIRRLEAKMGSPAAAAADARAPPPAEADGPGRLSPLFDCRSSTPAGARGRSPGAAWHCRRGALCRW